MFRKCHQAPSYCGVEYKSVDFQEKASIYISLGSDPSGFRGIDQVGKVRGGCISLLYAVS